jgi:hypothetical protein
MLGNLTIPRNGSFIITAIEINGIEQDTRRAAATFQRFCAWSLSRPLRGAATGRAVLSSFVEGREPP